MPEEGGWEDVSIYVFITRKPNPVEPGGAEVTEGEWRSVASTAPDFRVPTREDLGDSSFPGAPTQRDLIWIGHSEYPSVWFMWQHGQIEVKNPDEATVARMKSLAKVLGARVVSENGEQFDDVGRSAGFEPWSEFYDAPA